MGASLLAIEDLTTEFRGAAGTVRAVDRLSLTLERGEALGLVGESGSGKSTVAMSILGLVPDPPGRICSGRVLLEGEDLLTAEPERLRQLRGRRVALVPQEPVSALNPVLRVGQQLIEVLRLHHDLDRAAARARATEALAAVGIPQPAARLEAYPHQLSGGMRQRALLALALAGDPAVLLADEATSSVDVTLQAQLLDLLRQTQQRSGLALLMISHDLAVVANTCQRALVMYRGQEMETAPCEALFTAPAHPYTAELLSAARAVVGAQSRDAGSAQDAAALRGGCVYASRCAQAQDRCGEERPRICQPAPGRRVRCWFPLQGEQQ